MIFLTIVSCDSSNDREGNMVTSFQIDAELNQHLELFLREASKKNIEINSTLLGKMDLEFRDLPLNVLGTSRETKEGRIEIFINSSIQNGNSKWVTLHELGHGLLGMKHRDTPLSIMNPINVDELLEAEDPEKVFDEFFQKKYLYEL